MRNMLLGVVVMAVSAMAVGSAMAATQWNFGGSLRYTTFWTERDAGKSRIADLEGGGAGLKSDGRLDWQTQGNSRIKMYMQADVVEGFIDLGYSVSGNMVKTREYWGRYNFNEKAFIAIGQQKQLFNQYISNQVWDGDLGMGGIGTAYQSARPKIVLGYAGFRFALGKPYSGRSGLDASGGAVDGLGVKDIDTYLPQLQANYEYTADT